MPNAAEFSLPRGSVSAQGSHIPGKATIRPRSRESRQIDASPTVDSLEKQVRRDQAQHAVRIQGILVGETAIAAPHDSPGRRACQEFDRTHAHPQQRAHRHRGPGLPCLGTMEQQARSQSRLRRSTRTRGSADAQTGTGSPSRKQSPRRQGGDGDVGRGDGHLHRAQNQGEVPMVIKSGWCCRCASHSTANAANKAPVQAPASLT